MRRVLNRLGERFDVFLWSRAGFEAMPVVGLLVGLFIGWLLFG